MMIGGDKKAFRGRKPWPRVGGWLIILILVLVGGCATPYVGLSLNGYQSQTKPLPGAGVSFFVRPNQEPVNPLLDQEVGRKISGWLSRAGYGLVAREEADLVLTYAYGLDHGQTRYRAKDYPRVRTKVALAFGSGGHSHGGVGIGFSFGPGYSSYYGRPLIRHWLEIRVLDGPAFRAGDEVPVIWAGDAETFGQERNLRGVLDYLIVGTLKSLGQDTGQAVRVVIPKTDPDLLDLRRPGQ